MSETKEISKIFLINRISATLIIPIAIARRHELDKPSHVVVEETDKGILIRKLKLEDNTESESNAGLSGGGKPAADAASKPGGNTHHDVSQQP